MILNIKHCCHLICVEYYMVFEIAPLHPLPNEDRQEPPGKEEI